MLFDMPLSSLCCAKYSFIITLFAKVHQKAESVHAISPGVVHAQTPDLPSTPDEYVDIPPIQSNDSISTPFPKFTTHIRQAFYLHFSMRAMALFNIHTG